MTERALRLGLSSGLLLLASACGGGDAPSAATSAEAPLSPRGDAPAEHADLERRASRIVAIGASVTETLFALGVGDRVVAVDRTSVYPEAASALPKVGLPGQLSVEGVAAAKPTLILADGGAHGTTADPAGPALSRLEELGIEVVRLGDAPRTVEGAARRIEAIGAAVGKSDEAKGLVARLTLEVKDALAKKRAASPRVLFVYARGHRTLLVSGADTPAHDLLLLAGATNAVTEFSDFKPMSAETVIAAKPEVIVIPERGLASLGGIDGLLALPGIMETPAGKSRRVVAIDDLELLTFGPRLGAGLAKLISGLHETSTP